ncbi:MAG: endo-beta-N-acetylglucosaminidase [Cellulosilyticaceae bacterium]
MKKFTKIYSRKSISMLAALSIFSVNAMPVLASRAPNIAAPFTGDSLRGENQPYVYGLQFNDIRNWSPENYQHSEYLRAHVPLQKRITPFAPTQANPNLKSEAMYADITGDYNHDPGNSAPYTNEFSQYLFNYWQYLDIFSNWHGHWPLERLVDDNGKTLESEGTTVHLPNPAYTNAAHKNGALSLGEWFICRAGSKVTELMEKDENGNYPLGEKLVEIAEYYGFDGYFVNQEEHIPREDVQEFKDFLKWLRKQGLYIMWYDTIVDSGQLKYQNTLNDANRDWLVDEKDGRVPSDSMFVNYGWNTKTPVQARDYAESMGVDPFETVFLGVESEKNGGVFTQKAHNTVKDLDSILDETGNPIISFASFKPSQSIWGKVDQENNFNDKLQPPRRARDEYQWLIDERDRMYYTGPSQDVTKTGREYAEARPELGIFEAPTEWSGVAHYIAERSVIGGSTFHTNFNTGRGLDYYVNGEVSNDDEWGNINLQDIPVTWQWWVESTGTPLQVNFDFGREYNQGPNADYTAVGAYEGGSSLVFNGTLDAKNLVRLFKTDLKVTNQSTVEITYNKSSMTDASTMQLALIFQDGDEASDIVYLDIPESNVETDGWVTASIDLSDFKKETIATIGIAFDNNDEVIEDYQVNIGGLRVLDGKNYTPNAPKDFEIEEVFNTGEMTVSWDIEDFDRVQMYEITGVTEDGEKVFLGGAYDENYYIKPLIDQTTFTSLELVAVGKDGSKSRPTTLDIAHHAAPEIISAVPSEGELTLTWANPSASFTNMHIEVELDGEDDHSYEVTVPSSETSVTLSIPQIDGERFVATLTPLSKKKELQSVSISGRLVDNYVAPYMGTFHNFTLKGNHVRMTTPYSPDWRYVSVYENGEQLLLSHKNPPTLVEKGQRAKVELEFLPIKGTDSIIAVVLEDYSGNVSAPSYFHWNGTSSTPVATEDVPSEYLVD